mgnify:FL=1
MQAVATTRKRTAPKAERQQQLIQATIRSVAKHGLPDTTMSTVAGEAGLSQGIINLHFQSKERLLVETLRYLADEYTVSWQKALAAAGDSPAEQLAARVVADFKPPVSDRNKLAVWFAFWGESKTRPTYRKISADSDHEDRAEITRLCSAIGERCDSRTDPGTVAASLSAMTSGLWLELLTRPRSLSREQARAICMSYLATVYPGQFPEAGA